MIEDMFFVIIGLGCSEIPKKSIYEFGEYYSSFLSNENQYLEVLCNRNLYSTLYDIGKSLCLKPPSKNNQFLLDCIQKVDEYIEMNVNIIIIGHSYGGAVANRLGEYYSEVLPGLQNLSIVTFGSIYIPREPLRVPNYNYMLTNDVAINCNRCLNDTKCDLIWLKKDTDIQDKTVSVLSVFSKEAWQRHNSYDNLVKYVIGTKYIFISDKVLARFGFLDASQGIDFLEKKMSQGRLRRIFLD